jgi:hypothetical protein
MICEIVLTPNQAKRLIAKAVITLPQFQRAFRDGIIVIHPSSTTYFILYELFNEVPDGIWIMGVIKEGALCISRERQEIPKSEYTAGQASNFPFSWIIEKGILKKEKVKLELILKEMGPRDVYIKSCNAIDADRRAGVLFASSSGGTIALVLKYRELNGFTLLLPTGLEKLISLPIAEAAKYAPLSKVDKAMGQRVGLIPVKGEVIAEDQALSLLSGTKVFHFASGGLEGAQGATVLAVHGEQDKMRTVWEIVKDLEGAQIPRLKPVICSQCSQKQCSYHTED